MCVPAVLDIDAGRRPFLENPDRNQIALRGFVISQFQSPDAEVMRVDYGEQRN